MITKRSALLLYMIGAFATSIVLMGSSCHDGHQKNFLSGDCVVAGQIVKVASPEECNFTLFKGQFGNGP